MQLLNYMFKLNQKGVAHLLLIILLIAGLGVAVYLVGQSTNIFPKAYEPKTSTSIGVGTTAPISPSPTSSSSCTLGAYIKFEDITGNEPSEIFVSLSLKQPGTDIEKWKFYSVPAKNNTPPFYKGDNYRIGVGNVECGTYDMYIGSSGYQEKKFPNVLIDNNPNNDPELYVLYGPIARPVTCNACAADIVKSSRNRVDAQDNALLSSCFGKSPANTLPGGKACSPADINKDGFINQTDVDCLKSVYFQSCTAGPTPAPAKRVFVTSTTSNGNMGGLSGADTICQNRAGAAGLDGTWKAWLSDSTTSAASRLSHANIPYKTLDGKTIANNWADLTDGSLQNLVTRTQKNTNYYSGVWTGTNADGSVTASTGQANHCSNWTSDSSTDYELFIGAAGNNQTSYYWTRVDINLFPVSFFGCNNSNALYCFEQ